MVERIGFSESGTGQVEPDEQVNSFRKEKIMKVFEAVIVEVEEDKPGEVTEILYRVPDLILAHDSNMAKSQAAMIYAKGEPDAKIGPSIRVVVLPFG